MHILYVSQYFPPEMGAPAARVSELAHHWVRAGHRVTVLTGFPNHPAGRLHPDYREAYRRFGAREVIDGIEVIRTWLLPLPNRKPYERVLNYSSFWLSSSLRGMLLQRPDVVIGTSPQLLVGLSGWWLGRVKRVPFVFEVRDLWPESITASGVGNDQSLFVRTLRAISGFLYRSSTHIAVVTPAFQQNLVQQWQIDPQKIAIAQNGVETDLFTPDGPTAHVQQAFQLKGRFVVSYIGTLGLAHGLTTVLEAAVELQQSRPDVLFLLVGEGADRERLLQLVQAYGLTNVRFTGQQPREQIPALLRASHACLVLLKKADVFKTVIPTKMLECMACARPIILGVEGQARELIETAQAGLCIPPEDVPSLVASITRLHDDAALRQHLGDQGRRYIVEHLSRERMAHEYLHVLEQVVERKALKRSERWNVEALKR
ncbi:MAG: glycosyltransferase family 4 protein [Chloroflexaceae bacterium]|nr:glycosyltransferase family 4 protein [Chloroflexaceae bacterium]